MNTVKNFFKDETGLELSEYAVAAGLLALAVVVTFTNLGSAIEAGINALSGKIKTT
jgi:Flp pilus assembly pilin Flp